MTKRIFLILHVVVGIGMGGGGVKQTLNRHNKGSHFLQKMTSVDVLVVPGKIYLFGVIFQNGFSPKAVPPEVPGFGKI